VARWARKSGVSTWFVGLASGCAGALVTAGVLLASGGVPTSSPTMTAVQSTPQYPTPKASTGSGITPVLESVDPSVVGVTVNGPQGEEIGSGVIVSATGDQCYILTDSAQFSSTASSTQVEVTAEWGYVAKAHLVSVDPSAGVALVKAALQPIKEVRPATPGSVANVEDGEEVIAVASLYLAGSNSASNYWPGYMSDVSSYIEPANGADDGMFSLLVASMNVSQWAYGGALVDTNGNLLGIVTPVPGQSSQSGLTYVTPVDTAMADATAMMKGGRVSHAWVGVLDATDLSGPAAQHLGLDGAIEVESVAAGSPAAKAGIADNALITSLGGQPIGSVGAMINWLASAKPGQVVGVRWLAGGRWYSKDIILGTQPASASPT
ncbi:MAG TPA: trypsin-like peptidase domain-containing protein, partial [Acidimicrobiales bacterium]|nr:trypsin-like peptidase domain-containing protein [Acidimicrobiales bacterium]